MTPQLWLVTLQDKAMQGEPDIGMAFHLGTAREAAALGSEMEHAMTVFGRARCVATVKPIMTGRHYRMRALVRTCCSHTDP